MKGKAWRLLIVSLFGLGLLSFGGLASSMLASPAAPQVAGDEYWSALGGGMDGTAGFSVDVLVVDGSGTLYAGGDFTSAGVVSASGLAKWNGSTWSAVGGGLKYNTYPGNALALTVGGGGAVYVGGSFTHAGDVTATNIARWDGSAWSALGWGVNDAVFALAVDGSGNLYVGGAFTRAGSQDLIASRIAKWDGANWSAMNIGLGGGGASAIAVQGSNVYVGGDFATAGGADLPYLARWDGSGWSAVGSGVNGSVTALKVDKDGNLWVAGAFTLAGGLSTNGLAKWDGSSWSVLSGQYGTGPAGNIYDLVLDQAGNIYVGGSFRNAFVISDWNYMAKWSDGGGWSPLGSSVSGGDSGYEHVGSLAVDNSSHIYVGGNFTLAGGKPASHIARWFQPPAATYSISGRVTAAVAQPLAGVIVSAGAGGSATTDADGYYTITNVLTGAYTLTPTKASYTFAPPTRAVSVPPSASGQDFIGTTSATYTISGRVVDDGAQPLAGVMVSAGAGGSATTNASGYYTLTNVPAGSYTLTPAKSGYTFAPPTRAITVPPSAVGQNFTATAAPVTAGRTFVYHQIPLPGLDGVGGSDGQMTFSADGNRIAFASGYNPNKIYSVNADGSDLRLVDVYTPSCNCDSMVDISADGSKILSWEGGNIVRLAQADGSEAHSVLTIEGGYKDYRLSADGTRVFFSVDRGWTRQPSGEVRTGGLYVINTDGSDLRQIVTPEQVATVLSTTVWSEVPFNTCGDGRQLDVSDDGARIIFHVKMTSGCALLRVNSDGSGLQAYNVFPADYYWTVSNMGISGNGQTVFYMIGPNPCCSTWEWGVFNFDGSAHRILADWGDFNVQSDYGIGLSTDGSKLSTSSRGQLYNTDGSGALQLSVSGGSYSGDPESIIDAYQMAMSGDATRFAYLDWCGSSCPLALGLLEINPATLGAAPRINEVAIAPTYVLTGGRSSAVAAARVVTASTDTFLRVSNAFMKDGQEDGSFAKQVLLDDGAGEDKTAGDGLFTSGKLWVHSNELGPRVIRLRAEARAADGMRHATVVEFTPFELRADHPNTVASPSTGSTVVYTDAHSNPTVVLVPAEAVTTAVQIVYVPVGTVDTPVGAAFSGHAFNLEAYLGGNLLSGFTFAVPLTITIHYAEAEVTGLDETLFKLQTWNPAAGGWQEAACGAYDRHPADDWLAMPVCHLSQFALFEVSQSTQWQVFLPFILRQ